MIRPDRASRLPAAPIDDPAFTALKAEVIARTGHHYYDDKDDQLWERIAGRLTATGCASPADYLALLSDPVRGPREWPALESDVTINETFFFRFAEQFDLLRRTLLPRLIETRRETRRLRIWSVGCSTGAEPYSIAILLRDLLGTAIDDWRIAITGTDIDERALAVAREARFSAWALRTLDMEERARLFDREGDQYRLKARHRGLVRFEAHNMMTLLDEASALQFADYDLILCRNVLIYFRHDVTVAIVEQLARRLSEDGTLLLGHAEVGPDYAQVAVPQEVDGMLTYRRPGTPTALPAAPIALAALPPEPARPDPGPPTRRMLSPQAPLAPTPPADVAAELRAALAAGNGGEAMRFAAAESARSPQDPVPHYLGALGALALGRAADAERGFRRALYLDSGFAMAHYLLGRQLMAEGRDADGRRALTNAARIAAALDPEAELREGDGMTAGGLALAARHAIGVAR